jgi:uncharacterized protein YjdB
MRRQRIRWASVATIVCALELAAGCSGFFVSPTLSSITVSPSSANLQSVGQTMQLAATGVFDDGSTKNLSGSGTTWTSSDPSVVSVNSSGLITLVSASNGANASVTITASNGAATGSATVCAGTSCSNTSSSVAISPATTVYSLSASQGQTIQFSATANGAAVSATWTSSDPSVIAIDATQGTAQVLAQGSTTISAQTSSGTGSLTITVGP